MKILDHINASNVNGWDYSSNDDTFTIEFVTNYGRYYLTVRAIENLGAFSDDSYFFDERIIQKILKKQAYYLR